MLLEYVEQLLIMSERIDTLTSKHFINRYVTAIQKPFFISLFVTRVSWQPGSCNYWYWLPFRRSQVIPSPICSRSPENPLSGWSFRIQC